MNVCYEHGDLEKKKKCKSQECLGWKRPSSREISYLTMTVYVKVAR